jgi:uncharacterized protein (TIGR03118 family)
MANNARTLSVALWAALVTVCGANHALAAPIYAQVNLASDIPGMAAFTDPNLKNPWGMAFTATSPFWLSDQGASVSTLYNGAGQPQALVVGIPKTSPPTPPQGPTGQVANASTDFQLTPGNPARFIFATLAGTIAGWNPAVNANTAVTEFTATDHATYTGLANATAAGNNLLYAADFANRKIDVFNASFQKTSVAGTFTDPGGIPANYSPYNVQNVGGKLYVEYAKVDPITHRASEDLNQGIVNVFDTSGNFLQRLATDAHLSSPWGVTMAPAGFGGFGGDILVGNFGDGTISAFNPLTGAFLGALSDVQGNPISNDGLWAINFRAPGSGFDSNTLFFSAGINDEANGLFGAIQVVPEPGTMLLVGFAGCLLALGSKFRAANK